MSSTDETPASETPQYHMPDLPGSRRKFDDPVVERSVEASQGRSYQLLAEDPPLYRRTRNRERLPTAAPVQPFDAKPKQNEPQRHIVLPPAGQMVSQTMPALLVALAATAILAIGPLEPLGVPIWTFGLLVPSLLVFIFATAITRPLWRRTAVVNLLVLGVVFPVLVIRQSVVQIPYIDRSNGTLLAPLLATIGVILVLGAIAITAAVLCNEDPEYAGVLFLPAAMLVPLLGGPTDTTGFRTAILGIVLIYFAVAILTVVASMLPGAYPALVAPLSIAIEFLVLPANRAGAAFPIGSGWTSRLLFFSIVFVAVALAVIVPTLSLWVRETRRLMNRRSRIGSV